MTLPRLSPALVPGLPLGVTRPSAGGAGRMAHIGMGAFHRCHQAEYAEDLADWGIVGINLRAPSLQGLAAQGGLYTRLIRDGSRVEARVIGAVRRVVDSQASAVPALSVLSDPAIGVVTMTVTEKGYCHHPATGLLDLDHPDIVQDLAHPQAPRSLPGVLVRALEMRQGKPLTLISCDNIPANGAVLKGVVIGLAERFDAGLAGWIDRNCAFPATMVDRIAPAPVAADRDWVARELGYLDEAVVVCEPYKQWVIEERFAGLVPDWDRVGAQFVADVEPYETLKMRVLNGAQTTLAHLGALSGLEHTSDDMADPVLSGFVEAMLLGETLATLRVVPGIVAETYVGQSLARLRNTAIRHRNHQIATDGSQKIVQRLLNPIAHRLRRGQPVPLLSAALAGWMAYLIRPAARFGGQWVADDPYAVRVAAIADKVGHDAGRLVAAILRLDGIFAPEFGGNAGFVAGLARALDGVLTGDPRVYLLGLMASGLLPQSETAGYR